MLNAISWPEKYTPGTTDNFVSNEVIIPGLTAAEVWTYLNDTTWWPGYYKNVSNLGFDAGQGPCLAPDLKFRFTTFSFPVQAHVVEHIAPANGQPGRMAWTGYIDGDANNCLDVLHAWLIEDLPGNRVRILTQESQIGGPAKEMAVAKPNPMLNAHQDWLEGIVRTALENKR